MKRGKIYWLDIRLAGKRIRRSLHTDNKNIAFQKFRDLQDKLIAEYKKEDIRFEDFAKKYMEWAWNEKPASALREQQRLDKMLLFFENLGIRYLSDITPFHIEQLKAELKKRNLSKATINRYLQILRGLFYKAIDWEVYDKQNPLKKIRFYREDRHSQALSDAQTRKIMNTAKKISSKPGSLLQRCFHDMVILAINTGMRKSEILNLKWKDIKGEEIEVKGKGGLFH